MAAFYGAEISPLASFWLGMAWHGMAAGSAGVAPRFVA